MTQVTEQGGPARAGWNLNTDRRKSSAKLNPRKGPAVAEGTVVTQVSWDRGALKSEPAGLPAGSGATLYEHFRKAGR